MLEYIVSITDCYDGDALEPLLDMIWDGSILIYTQKMFFALSR